MRVRLPIQLYCSYSTNLWIQIKRYTACHNGVNATDFGSKAVDVPLTLGSSNEVMESFCRSCNAIVHLEHHIVQKREDSSSSPPLGPGKYS